MAGPTFWARFARLNAPLIAATLRKVADEVEALFPGAPKFAILLYHESEGGPTMGQIQVKDSDAPFAGTVTFLDAKGSPTTPDDVPQWTVDDDSIVSVVASDDGLSATLTPGSPGANAAATAQVTVTSTDTDGTQIVAVGAVTVTSGEAAVGDVSFAPAATP